MRIRAALLYAIAVLLILTIVGAIWYQKSTLEDRASATIDHLIINLYANGLDSTFGELGADSYFAKEHWKKLNMAIPEPSAPSWVIFSHRTKHHQTTNKLISVFLVRVESSLGNVVLDILVADESVVDWKVRSLGESSIDSTTLDRGCAITYAIVNELDSPMAELRPPWIEFPDTPRLSPTWYENSKHEYILRFGQSWSLLDSETREEIISRYPAPESWNGWYEILRETWAIDKLCEATD